MAKGWLDNYGVKENENNSSVSLPEGFVGMGYDTKGRNYSPAWGGQFQMGGSIPGAVGFSYARVGAPSKGPRRNQTDVTDASAQNGFKFDPKKFVKDQKANTPLQRSVDKESNSEDYRRWTDSKEYQDQVKANKIANDKAILKDRKNRIKNSVAAQNKPFTKDNWRQQLADETQATGDKFRMFPEDPDSFVDNWLNPGVLIGDMASSLGSAPLRAQQEDSYMPYATSIGVPLLAGGLEGLGAKSNKQFVNNLVNPFNMVPGYNSVEKVISKKLKIKDGGIIKDDRGQWDHPGEITEISGDTMATHGYGDIPLYVVPDKGKPRLVQPNTGTQKFPGAKKFTEYPMAKNGLRQEQKGLVNLDQLTNFTNYNKPQPGGWLNKYN